MEHYILTLRCADQPGIVRSLAEGIVQAKGNITESAQFSDPPTGLFCMRTSFESPEDDTEAIRSLVAGAVRRFQPVITLRREASRRRVLVMVSRFDHCVRDLLYRWDIGELPADLQLIVSNHETCRPLAERYGLPYHHIPVTTATKPEAERRLLDMVDEHEIDVVVLARYMQVLSDEACRKLEGRAINIHHSFLPGFKGSRPYHQAYERGVKLIGATAHFVTPDLDEGPIIEQDVARVGHGHTPEQLVAIGRDVERLVLARAVRLYVEDRVLLVGARTVVFG
ncbi:MAG TPA: formyltetrahydrofolate deformylase [Streptosporangiaceae bacterium]|nr:formyltetrahydrofolate deformylase [Streptosporangiaceae bacterium]